MDESEENGEEGHAQHAATLDAVSTLVKSSLEEAQGSVRRAFTKLLGMHPPGYLSTAVMKDSLHDAATMHLRRTVAHCRISDAARNRMEQLCDCARTVLMGEFTTRLHHARFGLCVSDCGGGCWDRGDAVECPRVHAPASDVFFERYVRRNLPCIVTGAFDEFPPVCSFKEDEHLRKRCGAREVKARFRFHDEVDGRRIFSLHERTMKFDAYLDSIAHQPAPLYLGGVALRSTLPELADEIDAASEGTPAARFGSCVGQPHAEGTYMYFGGGNNTTGLHYDPYENFILVVSGTKRVLLFAPSESAHLYPSQPPYYSYSPIPPMVKPEDGYRLHNFPRFAEAKAIEVEVHEGEMLYLPIFWWHGVQGHGRNLSLHWWAEMHPDKCEARNTSGSTCKKGSRVEQPL